MRTVGLAALVMAVCCACGAGPSVRPEVAVVKQPGAATTAPGTAAPDEPAELPVPVNDLGWRDCTAATLEASGLGPGPAGLVFECAEVPTPIDASRSAHGAFALGILRARLPGTPTKVAPLVLTSGADRPSSATLAALAAGPVPALLSTRPLVAVDRRGTGASTPIECGDLRAPMPRRAMLDLGQFSSPPVSGGDATDTVLALGRDATTVCTDFLSPYELAFDATHAAEDLDRVRSAWGVDRIGVLATGGGARVAAAYAAAHPDALGRLVVDSPAVLRGDAATAAESVVAGRQAALAAFARQCAALECALGPDPAAAITDLVTRARAGELGQISANALLVALTDHFGSPRGDATARVREFADTLAAAGRGETAGLQRRIDAAAAATQTDGQFVARCADGGQWPTPGRVRELRTDWGQRYPVFGPEGALALLLCAAWPTTPPPEDPATATAPTLVVAGTADPVAGDGASSVAGVLGAVGTPTTTITWLGSGHPALSHSECVQAAVAGYVETGLLPPDGGACPG